MDARPLRELLADLVGDAGARQAYGSDPAGYLAAHGHPDLPEPLVAEAVVSYADTAPVEVAEALAPFVAAHGPVPGAEQAGDWFDLLTSAETTDENPFDESLGTEPTTADWPDATELDFGAGAAMNEEPSMVPVVDDAPAGEPAPEPEWPTDSQLTPEPPIEGLTEPDDDDDEDGDLLD